MSTPTVQWPTKIEETWKPDHLVDGFEMKTFTFPNDYEGEVVSTLIRRLEPSKTSKKAVLYVHGFVDYFFQKELADHYNKWGFNFYAVDLRKYGRSLRPHQTPNFTQDMAEYFSDIKSSVEYIKNTDGNTKLLINGHSTGGLTTALYCHAFPDDANALFLNSPFFDWNESWVDEAVGLPILVGVFSKISKKANMPGALNSTYAESVHKNHKGEWDFNLDWKPLKGYPIKSGWLGAVGKGQKKLQSGLNIKVPILVMYSSASEKFTKWNDRLKEVDSVLDVKDIAKYSEKITQDKSSLTKIVITKGMHDLILSPLPVRTKAYEELENWLKKLNF